MEPDIYQNDWMGAGDIVDTKSGHICIIDL